MKREEHSFQFSYETRGERVTVTAPVSVPPCVSVKELTARMMASHRLPEFIRTRLHEALELFVTSKSREFYAQAGSKRVNEFLGDSQALSKVGEKWTKVFRQEVKEFAPPDTADPAQEFGELYHKLIHSASLSTLLNLEHTYALATADLERKRRTRMGALEDQQKRDIDRALSSNLTGDDQINQMTQRHFEMLEIESSKWEVELGRLQQQQRKAYREWLSNLEEDPALYTKKARAFSTSTASSRPSKSRAERNAPRLEESFTIHLGAQQKTTHNLRLLRANVLDLCRHKQQDPDGSPDPIRLQTALSLYSNNLCGLILLVDDRLNSYTGIKREFASVCQQSTDFHFPSLPEQFVGIEDSVTNKGPEYQNKQFELATGDFYVTRHSNLAEAHVVFHMVTDDSLLGDITSRHPVLLAIRNVLKVCFQHDVSVVTIPLLLTLEMKEEMTIQWCNRRAELVFKCVKGFMMEMATWAGSASRTIQFLVPQTLSADLFNTFAGTLPGIFKQSSPIVA